MSPPPADIGVHWTDEEIFTSLEGYACGSPLPHNVISGINPHNYRPENLPGGIWYFVSFNEKEDVEKGFWRAKGASCRIFANSSITGWRTTLEFYEGQPPDECKTDWMMQEYKITQNGPCEKGKLKDSTSLCRVFLLDGVTPNHEKQNPTVARVADRSQMQVTPSDAKSKRGEGSNRRSQVNVEDNDTRRLAATEHQSPENLLESYLREDYLELRDLETPSFSSESSSCVTISSDECFDSLALLQQLDTDINKESQRKDAGCKFNVSASCRSDKVLLCPATSASLFCSNRSKLEANENAKTDHLLPNSAPRRELHHKDVAALKTKGEEKLPKSRVGEASSGSLKAATDGERKPDTSRNRTKRPKKKFLCFFP